MAASQEKLFETEKQKPYTCEICKKAPPKSGYPRRWKWKTKRGFQNHRCYIDDLKAQQERDEIKRVLAEKERCRMKVFDEWTSLGLASRKIGDKIFYTGYNVTKPTHEWRGGQLRGRLVRVRYEEARQYFATNGTITLIEPMDRLDIDSIRKAIEENGLLSNMYHYRIDSKLSSACTSVFDDLESAEEQARKLQTEYDERCREAASYR